MINININYEHDEVRKLEISGHANYDEYGKDIICAGVSAVAIGALNNLDVNKYAIEVKEGLVKVEVIDEISNHDKIVLETLIIQLQTIRESYPKFIKIKM